MSGVPQDPSQNSIDQTQNERSTYEGQQGYGVEYQNTRFEGDNMERTPEGGRTGSYESSNVGGYGNSQGGAARTGDASEPAVLPPDPEAQQGQGGQ